MPQAPKSHRPHGDRPRDTRRYGAAERGYDTDWAKEKAAALREMIVESCNEWCRYCDNSKAVTLDHAIPPKRIAAVGSEQYREQFKNRRLWIPVCIKCNSKKQDLMPAELQKRYPEMYRHMIAVLSERGITINGR